MKKLFLSFLFLAFVFMVQAQDAKPTKEETVKFLNSICQKMIGRENAEYSEYSKFQICEFTNTSYIVKWKTNEPNHAEHLHTFFWENISWEDNTKITIDQTFGEIIKVLVEFKLGIPFKETFTTYNNDGSIRESKVTEGRGPFFRAYIPEEKFESFKKAILRLSEIAKEENKDPFKN